MAVPEVVAKLIDTLQAGSLRDRRTAAHELAALGPEAEPAIDQLCYCLKDEDAAVRVYSAEALGKIGPAALPALQVALKTRVDETRQAVVRALTAMPLDTPDLLPLLVQCFRDVDPTVRLHASDAVVNAGKEAVPYLIAGLKDEDPAFRRSCCVTLGRLGTAAKAALPALTEAIQNGRLGHEASQAIQAIHGNFLAVVIRFLRNALIRSHITIVVILLFAAFLITIVYIGHTLLKVSMAVMAVVLAWAIIGTILGAAIGYHTRWRRVGGIVGAIVLGLGSAVSGAMIGETFIRISEGVLRGLSDRRPAVKPSDEIEEEPLEKPGEKPPEDDSPIPILK